MARIVKLHVTPEADSTAFGVQFSADTVTWTPFSSSASSPTTPEDIALAELDNGDYTLDGLNAPGGNEAAASAGPWYQLRLKNGGGYGNWSDPFQIRGYPTAAELGALLATAGLSTAGVDLATAVRAGIRAFERETNRTYQAAAGTFVYDYPPRDDGILSLNRDLLSLTSLLVAGTVQTVNEAFWLLPEDGGQDGNPFQALQFPGRRWSGVNVWDWDWRGPLSGVTRRRALSITGIWGFSYSVPEDAYRSMLAYGALLLINPALFLSVGGIAAWKSADVSQEYAAVQKQFVEEWRRTALAPVSLLRRRNWLAM